MNTYRITYVNPAFAPQASHAFVDADDASQAVRTFWHETNAACVLDRRIYAVDRIDADARKGGGA